MKDFECKFEKSIVDWKGVLAGLIHFWWIPVIILILSGIIPVWLQKMTSQPDRYEIDYCLYIERDYNIANLPPMNNISALFSGDMVWERIDSGLQAEGSPALLDEERVVQGKASKDTDFYHIILEGKEPDRINQIFDKMLMILEEEIGNLEGFQGCRFISKRETKVTSALDGKKVKFYCLIFGMMISGCVLILISMLDKRIWSDYDLKLYFGKYYLGKTAKQDLEKETMSARILQRIKNAAGTDLYVNVTAEWLQSVEGKMLKQCCGRKLHPLNELWNPEAEEKAEHAVLLLIVQKGITTSEEINNAMEDGQIFGLDLAGCVMIA